MGKEENYKQFLHLSTAQYVDKWVAIVDGVVVSANTSFKATYDEALTKFPKKRPLMAKIPSKKVMIL